MKRVDRYQAVQVKLNDAMSAAMDLNLKVKIFKMNMSALSQRSKCWVKR
mgnify:CR=1 FL=1